MRVRQCRAERGCPDPESLDGQLWLKRQAFAEALLIAISASETALISRRFSWFFNAARARLVSRSGFDVEVIGRAGQSSTQQGLHHLIGLAECSVERGWIFTAGLGEVGAAAAFAANFLRYRSDDLAGLDP